MKKIINLVFLVFFCPLVLGAYVNTHIQNAGQNEAVTQSQANQTLDLSSQTFGLTGPFSLGMQYSHLFGAYLTGAFTQAFLQANAFSITGEVGKKQYRINGTLAREVTSHQRVKVSAEHLSQKASYDFASGSTDQWVGQNAYGLTYQFLLANKILKDINLNTFYSRTVGKTLRSVNFTQGGILYQNLRHIAGGIERSISAGVDLLPLHKSLVGLQLSYDDVYYHGRYENLDSDNKAGLGATISLEQLVTRHVKFKLLASNRQTDNTYQAEIDWLLRTVPGSQLILQLNGERIIGKSGMSNDSQVGVNLSYAFGGNTIGHPAQYDDFSNSGSLGNLSDWTATPAVYMDQVLAVKDEAKIALMPSTLFGKGGLQSAENSDEYTVIAYVNKPLDLDVSKYFQKPKTAGSTYHYSAQGLPNELQLKDHELLGKFTKKEVGTYNVTLHRTNNQKTKLMDLQDAQFMEVQNNSPVKLKIKVMAGDVPYPETQNKPHDQVLQPGDNVNLKFTGLYFFDSDYEDGLFFDPAYRMGNTNFSATGLDGSNLQFSVSSHIITYDQRQVLQYTLEIKGTLPQDSEGKTFNVSIAAANGIGPATGTQDFKIKVLSQPSMDMNTQKVTYNQSASIDMTPYLHPGTGNAIAKVTSPTLSNDSLNFTVDNGKTTLSSTIVSHGPTMSDETIDDVIVTDNQGDFSPKQSMKLEIAGPPVWKSNPDNITYKVGESISKIPLAEHFDIPQNSGQINDWDIEVKGQNGFDMKGAAAVEAITGLHIVNNELVGQLKNIVMFSPFTVIVAAKNAQGSSIDNAPIMPSPKSAEFQMTVDSANDVDQYCPDISQLTEDSTRHISGVNSQGIVFISPTNQQLVEGKKLEALNFASFDKNSDRKNKLACEYHVENGMFYDIVAKTTFKSDSLFKNGTKLCGKSFDNQNNIPVTDCPLRT